VRGTLNEGSFSCRRTRAVGKRKYYQRLENADRGEEMISGTGSGGTNRGEEAVMCGGGGKEGSLKKNLVNDEKKGISCFKSAFRKATFLGRKQ